MSDTQRLTAQRSRPIRVLFVAGADFYSGAERALLLTARSLADAGHHPFVAVGTRGEFLNQLGEHGIPCAHAPLYFTGISTVHRWAIALARLARLARRHRAEVIHANEAPSFQIAGYAARLLRLPAITHVRFPEGAAGYAWYLKSGFRKALFVSHALRRDVQAAAPGIFDGRADVLHDGVVLPRLPGERERASGRAALGIPDDRPAIVQAGQVVEIKGIWDFIDAAKILIEQGVRATFVVLGDDLKDHGRTRRDAEARVKAVGIDPHFRFLGFRADAPALIPLFDVVAVPSHIEPLGNATLEAMAAGRPVIGTRVGGIPEMVMHDETGVLVPPKAPAELAAALERLIADPALRARFGAAGRERARSAFSLEAHAARLEQIYSGL
ncbi:MAG TPA: glycosyltransferase family 4 protein [Vicinamibacterales bacterium]|nr:glycosyltransferase family 4 protein [Vicinamibacterales bacterium]